MRRIYRYLRHVFVPHHGNDHRPHALRPMIAGSLLAAVLVIQGWMFMESVVFHNPNSFLASIVSSVLVDLTNQDRAENDAKPLRVNAQLAQAAQLKAEDMASRGYFSHVGPGGEMPWKWIKQVGYTYTYAGENLAVDFSDSEAVTKAWMNSPTHRANVVNPKFTEMGIGYASGMYNGKETTFVVEFFAAPASVAWEAPAVAVDTLKKETSTRGEVVAPRLATSTSSSSLPVAQVTTASSALVLGVMTTEEDQEIVSSASSWWQKLLASPGTFGSYALLTLLAIVIFSLILYILIKEHAHHPILILCGIIMITAISLALWIDRRAFIDNVGVPQGISNAASVVGALGHR